MQEPTFEKKNILVTGGAGFIGSHLCEKLLQDSRVICLDNFTTSQESNIDLLLKNPDFEFIRHDINTPFDLDTFPELARFKLKFQGIQEIYHLACPTSPKKFEQYRMQTLYANSVGMKNVLDVGVKYKARVVHASTSVVYGERPTDGHPFKEEEYGAVNTLTPRSCYDEGKRFAEACCTTYQDVHGLDVRIARIFRTYGPRMALFDGHMLPDFIINALDNKELVIYGDETFATSLVFVSDLADGLMKLMKAPKGIGAVNFGSDLDMKIVDVAQSIVQMTGSKSRITFKPPLIFMTPLGLPDLSKAKDKLGWIPLVGVTDGLKKTIDYTVAHKGLLGFKS
ncbi:MAG: NAD-dependent epimerase/dehydratase family protein [Patescibacteria group bacterium]|nr:NAD-dependent epimerase/dehydratase family protein [Patescibacteria group bacterium]MBU2509098.1 NAD-dependent epimerase/dehydratase family protein [Patescibacteria group bacterium]